MKLPQIGTTFKWNYLALSFALPAGLLLIMMFICSIAPFGSYTMLYSDMYHQYYPFFLEFRRALRSGESLLWTWSVGMGMDYLGLISYYLASPLNLLTVLLPESWMLSYFSLLLPIKLGLASLFFAIFLKKLFHTNDLSLPLFGSFYGMCAWALGYQWNIMWLDTFALLPLVVLGAISLLKEKKYILYTLTLALSILINYYIGLFTCIFIFLLFWIYEICRFKSIGRFFADLCRIGIFTLIAIGMTAILFLPALSALQDTHSNVNHFPTGFDLNFLSEQAETAAKEAWAAYKTAKEAGNGNLKLWLDAVLVSIPPIFSAMRQVAGNIPGGQTPTYMEGLPNLYCGVLPMLLGFLFLMSKNVRLRDKLCSVGLLIFLMLSFIIRQLDYIWHGFHFTNQIPYRFSFLFSFVVLYMGYRAWLLRKEFPLWKIILSGILSLGLLFISKENLTDPLFWIFNLSFLGLYLFFLVYDHSGFSALKQILTLPNNAEQTLEYPDILPLPRRRLNPLVLAGILAMELVLNMAIFISGFSVYDYDYPKKEDDAAAMFDLLEQMDDGQQLFYRTEVTHAQTLNDGALNGYHGISTFTSSANVATTEFLQCLGAAAYNSWNRYCYEDSSPVSNLFLNLKYQVERDNTPAPNAYFDVIASEHGISILQNNAYLPLGFLAQQPLSELHFSTGNRSFAFQNKLFAAATGLYENAWEILSNSNLTVSCQGDIALDGNPSSGYAKFTTGSEGGTLIYTYSVAKDGFMSLDLSLYQQKNFSVWLNGKKLYDESYTLNQIMAVGNVKPDDVVEVKVKCKENTNSSVTIRAAMLNEAVFRQGYDILNASTLHLTDFSTNKISGDIYCNRDGLLYTSVPQDGNWQVYVDGKKTEPTLLADVMLCVPLSQGSHSIDLQYENKAFTLGALVTLGSCVLFEAVILTDILTHRRKKSV